MSHHRSALGSTFPNANFSVGLQQLRRRYRYRSYQARFSQPNQAVTIIDSEGKTRNARVGQVLGHLGLQRYEEDIANAAILCIDRFRRIEHFRYHLRCQQCGSFTGINR